MMMALNGAGARDSHYGKILMVKSNVDNKQPQSSLYSVNLNSKICTANFYDSAQKGDTV